MASGVTPLDLVGAVQGNFDAFASIAQQPHHALERARAALPSLVLTPQGLLNVLHALQHNRVSRDDIQRWASFVRRGYVAGATKADLPIKPIDIEYAPPYEDRIVAVLSRLDELGDLIDGDISNEELTMMIQSLQQ